MSAGEGVSQEERATSPSDECHLLEIQRFSRATLVSADGTPYSEFRRGLKPRFALVWFHIALHYVALALIAGSLAYWPGLLSWPAWVASVGAGSVAIGFVVSSLTNFFHEASHYNLAPNKTLSDQLASIFICPIVGVNLKSYRPIHFAHHRHLGTPMDEEVSYFDPLDLRTMVEALIPLKVARMLCHPGTPGRAPAAEKGTREVAKAAMALHATVLLVSALAGRWALALAWAGGMAAFFPFFQTLRQILEHRGFDAVSTVNYHVVPQGAVARMFGDGPLASTLGSAGFNRHMLHHWEPQISYTRLRDLERFLNTTPAGRAVDKGRTTYLATFKRLFKPRWEPRA